MSTKIEIKTIIATRFLPVTEMHSKHNMNSFKLKKVQENKYNGEDYSLEQVG